MPSRATLAMKGGGCVFARNRIFGMAVRKISAQSCAARPCVRPAQKLGPGSAERLHFGWVVADSLVSSEDNPLILSRLL